MGRVEWSPSVCTQSMSKSQVVRASAWEGGSEREDRYKEAIAEETVEGVGATERSPGAASRSPNLWPREHSYPSFHSVRSYPLCGWLSWNGGRFGVLLNVPHSVLTRVHPIQWRWDNSAPHPVFLGPPGHEAEEPHMYFPATHILLLGANYSYTVLLRALDPFRNICFIARQQSCLGAESRRGLAAVSLWYDSFRLYPERFSCKSGLHLVSFPSKQSENGHSTAAFPLEHLKDDLVSLESLKTQEKRASGFSQGTVSLSITIHVPLVQFPVLWHKNFDIPVDAL